MQSVLDRLQSIPVSNRPSVGEISIPGHSCPKPVSPVVVPHWNSVSMSHRVVGPEQSVPNLKVLECSNVALASVPVNYNSIASTPDQVVIPPKAAEAAFRGVPKH